MKKSVFVLFLILVLPLNAMAQQGETVLIEDGPRGYYVAPDQGFSHQAYPLVILLHDWWGMNAHVRQTAEKLQKQGFAVFSMDLYNDRTAQSGAEAYRYQQELSDERIFDDLRKVLAYFREDPQINLQRVGILGWSKGASLALEFAVLEPRKIHVLGLYDLSVRVDERLEVVRAPIIVFWGEKDRSVSKNQIRDFKFRLDQGRRRLTTQIYPGIKPGFFNPLNMGYDQGTAEDSWGKLVEFFRINLV